MLTHRVYKTGNKNVKRENKNARTNEIANKGKVRKRKKNGRERERERRRMKVK